MVKEPDIIKELKEAERLGLFSSGSGAPTEDTLIKKEKSSQENSQLTTLFKEENLAKKEDFFFDSFDNFVFENSGIPMGVFGEDHVISRCNRFFETLSGYTKKEIEGIMHWYDFVPEDDRKWMMTYHQQRNIGQGNPPNEYDCGFIGKNGQRKTVHITVNKPAHSKNRVVSLVDVTDWRKTEESLQESERHFQTLFNNMVDPVVIIDSKGNFLDVTDKMEEITGFKKEEVIGKNFMKLSFLTAKSKAIAIKNLGKRMMGMNVEPYEIEVLIKDGKKIPFEINATKIEYKGQKADMVNFRDVRERRKAEKELKQSQIFLEKLIEQLPVGVQAADTPNCNLTLVNKEAGRILGIHRKKSFKKNGKNTKHFAGDRFSADGSPLSIEDLPLQKAVLRGKETHNEEMQLHSPNGEKRTILCNAAPVYDENGNILRGVETFLDITARKRIEKKLDLERKQMLSLFDSLEGIIYVTDPKTYEILYANPKLKKAFGKDLVGEICYQVLQDKDAPCDFCTNDIIFKKENKYKPYYWEFHNPIVDRDYELTDRVIQWPDGRDVRFELAYDITELKQSHKELEDAHEALNSVNLRLQQIVKEKTEELSSQNQELISMNEELQSTQKELQKHVERVDALVKQKDEFIHMLGHDLKNPMTPIFTLLPIAEKKTQNPKSKEIIQHVIQNARRMKDIIEETLKIARLNDISRTIDPEEFSLATEIKTIIDEHKTLLDDHQFKVEIDIEDHIDIKYDKHQFYDLVSNFVTNAVKYTPNDTEGFFGISMNQTDDEIILSFADHGSGLSDEQKGKIFEKFYKFGTPREGMGSTGLGLSICQRIVEKHGGRIWVESDGFGKGSTFFVSIKKEGEDVMLFD